MSDNIGAYVARLIELGVPPTEAATIAAEIFVAGVQASAYRDDVKPRSPGANRTARWRERKASQSVTESVTVTSQTLSPPNGPPPPPAPPSPPLNPPTLSGAPAGTRQTGMAMQAAFDSFWQAYPKRDGSNPRKPAFERFASKVRAGADPGEIVRGAEAYARSMAGKEAQFVAQAVTWLNQERWRDHAPPAGLFAGPEPPIPKPAPAASPEELDRRKRQAVANGYWSQMLWGPVPDDIRERVNVQ